MSWEYCCPQCKAMLNPDRTITLVAEFKEARIMVGFHPRPGKYEVYLPPGVVAEDGTKWNFFCPLCQENLVTEKDADLCGLELRLDGKPVQVLFSRVVNEHATFLIYENTIRDKFGKDAVRYAARLSQLKYMQG